jgi:hypothetical protein
MAIEVDGKDYIVQTAEGPDRRWTTAEQFADPFSAKQWAEHHLHSHTADAVRVVQVRLVGHRNPDKTFNWNGDIGDKDDKGIA